MIIIFLLFLVQFAVACACLALSESHQRSLYNSGWQAASRELRKEAQDLFGCCGFDETTQNSTMSPSDQGGSGFGHPSCSQVICVLNVLYIQYVVIAIFCQSVRSPRLVCFLSHLLVPYSLSFIAPYDSSVC